MTRSISGSLLVIGLAATLLAQQPVAPKDMSVLADRAQEYLRLTTAGQRMKAAELILPERRARFLASGSLPWLEAKVIGIEFGEDATHASVRMAVKTLMLASGNVANTVLNDPWTWKDGNWYLDLQDVPGPFSGNASKGTADADAVAREVNSRFRFVRDRFDVGMIIQGVRKELIVPIEYSSEAPVRVSAKVEGGLFGIDSSSQFVTKQSRQIKLWVGSETFEGPFQFPLTLSLYRDGVTVDRMVFVQGKIFAPLTFWQEPAVFQLGAGRDLQVLVKNNTEELITIISVYHDGKFDVLELPTTLGPQSEGKVRLRWRPDGGPPRRISIKLQQPVYGIDLFDFNLRVSGNP